MCESVEPSRAWWARTKTFWLTFDRRGASEKFWILHIWQNNRMNACRLVIRVIKQWTHVNLMHGAIETMLWLPIYEVIGDCLTFGIRFFLFSLFDQATFFFINWWTQFTISVLISIFDSLWCQFFCSHIVIHCTYSCIFWFIFSCVTNHFGIVGHHCRRPSPVEPQSIQSQVAIACAVGLLQFDFASEWCLGLGARSQVIW